MTAVQWLIEQTRKPEWHSLKRGDILEQALEMERQQIIDAWESGFNQAYKLPLNREINTPAEYYETFKNETK
jgi:hypothetical protein